MKKLFLIFSLLFVFVGAQSQIKYPYGEPKQVTYAIGDTTTTGVVTLASVYDNLSIYKINCDTNLTINATTLNARLIKGARIIFEIYEQTGNADTITWGTNLGGAATATPAGKRTIVEFVYTGPGFYKVAQTQVN